MSYEHFQKMFSMVKFPAGESHLNLSQYGKDVITFLEKELVIEIELKDFNGIMMLLVADQLLDKLGIYVKWHAPYFPFARQDRRRNSSDGDELTLAISMMKEIDITIVDPHSDVAGILRHIPQSSCVDMYRKAGAFKNNAVVIIPDQGATKKSYTWTKEEVVVQGSKVRDTATGKLSGFSIPPNSPIAGYPCIIVDDICDGGGTFLGLASELKKQQAGDLTLCVTHGLFTKGLDSLLSTFDHIYTFGERRFQDTELQMLSFQDLYTQGQKI